MGLPRAWDKKGNKRKAFMSSCLKAGASAAPMTQQDTMKKCNADASAKSLKGVPPRTRWIDGRSSVP
jgi:hypothetical protein